MHARILLHAGFLCGLATVLVAWSQVSSPKTVGIQVDGMVRWHQTRQVQVGSVLREAEVTLGPGDKITPLLTAALGPESTIRIQRAVPLALSYNGSSQDPLQTTAPTVGALLKEQGITISPHDTLRLSGKKVNASTPLRPGSPKTAAMVETSPPNGGDLPLLEVRTSRPIYVHDYGLVTEVHSVADTVQAALTAAGFSLGPADLILPTGTTLIQAGQHILVRRARTVHLQLNGEPKAVQTLAGSVGQVLQQAQVSLLPADQVTPPLATPVSPGMTIAVVRITERQMVLEEVIPYKTEYVADSELEYGEQRVSSAGIPGLRKRDIRVLYRNGQESQRISQREWVETAPEAAVVHYGTKIVLRTVDTPAGPLQYWRLMRVWATWYAPFSAGKRPDNPGYGITSLGYEVHKGIIAVDPRVIPYLTEMYVPGYGVGIAADTGGGVRGQMIDLGFADDEEHDWYSRWVDIYFLGPGPNPSSIRPPGT